MRKRSFPMRNALAVMTLTTATIAAHAALNFDQYLVKQSIEAKSAVYVGSAGSLLALVPSSASEDIRNTVTELSITGQLLNSTYIGLNPAVIELSNDNTVAYVGMMNAPIVRAYDVGSRTAGAEIQLPRHFAGTPGSSESRAVALAISPIDNGTLSILSRGEKIRNWTELRTYSEGVLRPKVIGIFDPESEDPYINGIADIAYADDGAQLYGAEFSGARLQVIHADEQGLTYSGQMATPVNTHFDLDGNTLYMSDGRVVDLGLDIQLGIYNGNGRLLSRVVHDQASGLVFGAYGNGDVTVFDLATFTPIATFNNHLPLVNVLDLISLGHGNLALVGTGSDGVSRLYLMQAVPELSSIWQWSIGGMALTLLYARRRRSDHTRTGPPSSKAHHENQTGGWA